MWLLIPILFQLSEGQGVSKGLYRELFNFPLKDNPFFAKIMAGGSMFSGEGIEKPGMSSSGFTCNTMGNLNCGDTPIRCRGLGVIDCTKACPGSESEFKKFISVMEDPEFEKKYPELHKMRAGQQSKPQDEKENEEKLPEKEDSKKAFFNMLSQCDTFSEETMAFIKLANGGGGGGIGSNEESVLQKVDEDAVAGFGDYSYSYDDPPSSESIQEISTEEEKINFTERSLDNKNKIDSTRIQHNLKLKTSSNVIDREPKEGLKEENSVSINTVTQIGEITKQNLKEDESGFNDTEQKDMATQSDNEEGIERNKMDSKETLLKDFREKTPDNFEMEEKLNPKYLTSVYNGKKIVNDPKDAEIYYLKNIEDLKQYENKKRNIGKSSNYIRSAESESSEEKIESEMPMSLPLSTLETLIPFPETNKNLSSTEEVDIDMNTENLRRKRDAVELKEIVNAKMLKYFLSEAVKRAKQMELHPEWTQNQHKYTLKLAKEVLRLKREIGTSAENGNSDMKCVVRNMTCSEFPSKLNCSGLGVGHCGSRADLLAYILTPQVVVISLFSIMAVATLIMTLAYYLYKKKAEAQISPAAPNLSTVATKNGPGVP